MLYYHLVPARVSEGGCLSLHRCIEKINEANFSPQSSTPWQRLRGEIDKSLMKRIGEKYFEAYIDVRISFLSFSILFDFPLSRRSPLPSNCQLCSVIVEKEREREAVRVCVREKET